MIKNSESSTAHYRRLVDVLGAKYVGTSVESPFDFIHIAKKGVNAGIIHNFRTYFNITRGKAANMLNISEPTLYRWLKTNKDLDRDASVKLLEITDLFLYGIEVFDEKEKFLTWLQLSNTALGGMTPQELIEVPGGFAKVRDELGRIEYGVFS